MYLIFSLSIFSRVSCSSGISFVPVATLYVERVLESVVRLLRLPEKTKIKDWCGAGVDIVACMHGPEHITQALTHTHTLTHLSQFGHIFTLDVASGCLKLICNHNNNNKHSAES